MYIQVLPLETETQPVIALGCALLLLGTRLREPTLTTTKDVLGAWVLMGALVVYAAIGVVQGASPLTELGKYLVGPVVFVAYRARTHLLRRGYVRVVLALLCAVAVLTIAVPNAVASMYSVILGRGAASTVAHGARGVAILTPEPSYFAFFAVLLFAALETLKIRGEMSSRAYLISVAAVMVLALVTRSALVYVYVAVLFWPRFYYSTVKGKVRLAGAVAVALAALAMLATENRLFEVARRVAATQCASVDCITDALFFADPSGGTRVLMNVTGVAAMLLKPLGHGLGEFANSWIGVAQHFDIPIGAHEVTASFMGASHVRAQAYFPNLANDVGVVAFLLAYIVGAGHRLSSVVHVRRLQMGIVCVVGVMFVFQGQVANPIPWMLLAMAKDMGALAHRVVTAAGSRGSQWSAPAFGKPV